MFIYWAAFDSHMGYNITSYSYLNTNFFRIIIIIITKYV